MPRDRADSHWIVPTESKPDRKARLRQAVVDKKELDDERSVARELDVEAHRAFGDGNVEIPDDRTHKPDGERRRDSDGGHPHRDERPLQKIGQVLAQDLGIHLRVTFLWGGLDR